MDIDTALLQFGDVKRRAISEYRRFVMEEFGADSKPDLTGGGLIRSQGGWSRVLGLRRSGQKEEFDERKLGSGDFVQAMLSEVEERQLRQTELRRRGKGIADIIREERRNCGVKEKELILGSRRRKVSLTRAAIALRCNLRLDVQGPRSRDISVLIQPASTAQSSERKGRYELCTKCINVP
jgi:putative transposase